VSFKSPSFGRLANKNVVEDDFPEFEELVMYRNQETFYPVEWALLPTPSGGLVLGRKRQETSATSFMADQMVSGYSAGDLSTPTTPDLSRPATPVETQDQKDAAPSASLDAQSQVTSSDGDEDNPDQQEDGGAAVGTSSKPAPDCAGDDSSEEESSGGVNL